VYEHGDAEGEINTREGGKERIKEIMKERKRGSGRENPRQEGYEKNDRKKGQSQERDPQYYKRSEEPRSNT